MLFCIDTNELNLQNVGLQETSWFCPNQGLFIAESLQKSYFL